MDYLIVMIAFIGTIFGGFLASFAKEKGKNYAQKKDIDNILERISETTHKVEGIKADISETSWINQRIWVIRQETYRSIFGHLFNIKNHVSNNYVDYLNWENNENLKYSIDSRHDSNHAEKMKQIEEFDRSHNDPVKLKKDQHIKNDYLKSLDGLIQELEVNAIYVNEEVGQNIEKLKNELSTQNEWEGEDEYFGRLHHETNICINHIRECSKKDLQFKSTEITTDII